MFSLIFINISFPKEIIVDKKGSTQSIKEAIQLAETGDVIKIKKGTYIEGNIVLTKSVSIIGIDYPEISGENKYEILTITANNISITGIKFSNVGRSFIKDNAAVKIENSSNCIIEKNIFLNNFFGIYLSKSSNCTIANNEIHSNSVTETNSGNGIHQWYCREIKIYNNNISGHRDGIYLEFCREAFISKNISKKNVRYGLHFMYSDSCKYFENIFSYNGAGVAVMYSSFIEMELNKFEFNWGPSSFGLLLKDIRNSNISKNILQKNSVGLYAEASSNLLIEQNTFLENGWALKLMANSMDNTFIRNNFISNSFDVATNSRSNFSTFENNYWDSYKGYDLNKDGFGDIPFRPVRLFSVIVTQNPTALILLRSFFIDVLDVAERIIPALTPANLMDKKPLMRKYL